MKIEEKNRIVENIINYIDKYFHENHYTGISVPYTEVIYDFSSKEKLKEQLISIINGENKPIYNLGDRIKIKNEVGYIVDLYPNGKPKWIMLGKEFGRNITWNDAMKLKLPDGWKMLNMSELAYLKKNLEKLNYKFSIWSSSMLVGSLADNSMAWYLNLQENQFACHKKSDTNSNISMRAFKKLENEKVTEISKRINRKRNKG